MPATIYRIRLRTILFSLLVLLCSSSAFGQVTLTLGSGSLLAGNSISLNLSLSAPSGSAPVGLEWMIPYSTGINNISISAGSALTAAGKTLQCVNSSGQMICLASGLNTNPIPNGVVGIVTISLASGINVPSLVLSLINPSGVTANGTAMNVSGVAGVLSVLGSIISGLSPDTQPPTAPNNLAASALTSTQINLSWTASTDDTGVTGYLLERCQGAGCTNFAQIAAPTSNAYSDTNVTAGASYGYRVRATDAAGNLSPYSSTARAITPAAITGSTPDGLVAAYSFNEGTGNTVADSSGNGNTGTIVNATWTSSGKFGSGLVFNGSNALVTINDSPSLHLTSSMTLEAWVNPTTVNNVWRDVIYKGNDNYYLEATSNSSGVPAAGSTIGEVYGTAGLASNTWTHLAATYDGAILRLYVNGVQVASAARTGNLPTSTNPLEIGGDSIFGQYFKGTIDEVRIYNVALTQAQIQVDMNAAVGVTAISTASPIVPAGLVAAYTFDEGTGATVHDVSGNGNTGTVTNATWTNAGKYGNALVFNGAARVVINDSASLHLTTAMTLEAWIKPSVTKSVWTDIIYKGNDNYFLEGSSPRTAPAAGGILGSVNLVTYGIQAIPAQTWTHLAATYDGATLRLYVNGAQVSSLAQKGLIATSNNPLEIGGDSIFGQYFQGAIDEVRIYKVALTQAQIQADMNAPVGASVIQLTADLSTMIASSAAPANVTAMDDNTSAPQPQMALAVLSCAPKTVQVGGNSSCQIRIAPSEAPVNLRLGSDSGQVRLPAVVTVRPNQSVLRFRISVDREASQQTATVYASVGGAAIQDNLAIISSGPVLTVPGRQLARFGELLQFAVRAVDPDELPLQLSAANLPAGASFDSSTGKFAWTPDASQTGTYDIFFSATNSARASSTAHVSVDVGSGTPILDTAQPFACSPGAIATLNGKWLAPSGSKFSQPSGSATELGGTRVSVDGRYAPVLFASDTRVSFLCPDLDPGSQFSIAVETTSGATAPLMIVMQYATPTIMASDTSEAMISFPDSGELVQPRTFQEPAHPAQPGDSILLWATGLGPNPTQASVAVTLDGVAAEIESLQPVDGYTGLYTIRVRVPEAVSIGDAVPAQVGVTGSNGDQLTSAVVTFATEPALQ